MAVTAPTILAPVAGISLPIDGGAVWQVLFDPFSGDGAQQYMQVQVSTGTGGAFVAGIIFDSLIREHDDDLVHIDANGEIMDIYPSLFSPAAGSGQTLYIRGLRRSNVPETSSFGSEVTLTCETTLTAADARTVR